MFAIVKFQKIIQSNSVKFDVDLLAAASEMDFSGKPVFAKIRLKAFSAICVALLASVEPAVHHFISQNQLS